jgi:hypothetical protein
VGTVNDPNAFPASATNTLTVTKAAATVNLGNLVQTYNGAARPVTANTVPYGLLVSLTYNGAAAAPTNAGSYTVIGTVVDPLYQGGRTNTLTVGKANALVTLTNFLQLYDGTAKSVLVSTMPSGLAVNVTYNGLNFAPTNTGSYRVVALVNEMNYQGGATNTLIIFAPIRLSASVLPDGSFHGSFTNTPGTSFTVLAATNLSVALTNWLPLGGAIEGPAGHFHFNDLQTTNNPVRFYRVRLP